METISTLNRPHEASTRRWRNAGLRALIGLLAVCALLYAGAIGAMWLGQERLLFHPVPLPADFDFKQGPDVTERWIDVPGARLNALHLRRPGAAGVVFFLHGNSGNLQSWFVNTDFYRQLNLDLVMIDFRGYGKSSGRIESQAQLQADVRAAWETIAPEYAGRRRIIYGRSLGSGLAAALAAQVQPELTVLVSPYQSMVAVAHDHYPWVPAAVLRYPLHTDEVLGAVRGPVLLAHGERDTLIAPQHSRALLGVARQAQLLLVPEAAHADIHQFNIYLDGLRAALAPGNR